MLCQCWAFVKHFGRDKWLRKGILGDFGSYVGPLFGTLGGTNGFARACILGDFGGHAGPLLDQEKR